MSTSRRAFLTACGAAALSLPLSGCTTRAVPGGGRGTDYPTHSIQYVLPFDPGGESDITARLQQKPLERVLGTPIVVSNRPGGGGAVGWSELANQSRPDGYTIMGANIPHVILQPLARGEAGYETADIHWAYIFQSTPNALVVSEDRGYGTLEDFLDAAQDRTLTLGGSGSYTANHIGTLALARDAGAQLTYVPFSGTAAASPALLGGQVDALMTYNTEALELRDDGMRVLAVASEERLPEFPDVPTLVESGFDIVEGAWRGIAVPPDTPDAVVETLADAFAQVNQDPEVIEQSKRLGFHLEDMGPDESADFTAQRTQAARELLEDFDLVHE
ncbi:tripartite-type tricarboxylate transporter receptor subunit TctC [Spinactinospora alkalitolerans]|uniref:Tripartite-type tricarboxylate transporter receptor subunit TctC n=1 Tax=Spinactinospora alkalitolerans TaxID=687207 RepID=A0A852TVZ1_9ACTN|nr:tripartite tricarboxylate transporter substrate binding protein [Spinactinospora alkalitolerans]NYE47891.1 tripartite-type tricarboxylate transporter receptor subunit TctC [Spinactinospora alkalitolerans]